MLNLDEVRALGQLLENNWGGTGHDSRFATVGTIAGKLAGEQMTLRYTTIVNFDRSREDMLQHQLRALRDESETSLRNRLGEIKSRFKEATGRALKAKEVRNDDDVEMTSVSSFSPRGTAYYRRHLVFEVS